MKRYSTNKNLRYSLRKGTKGVVSVAVAALLLGPVSPVFVNAQSASLAETNDPIALEVQPGYAGGFDDANAINFIGNAGALAGVVQSYTWEYTPVLSATPALGGQIKVTYTDGSVDYVDVNIAASQLTDAEMYTPMAVTGISLDPSTVFENLPASDFISNKDSIPGATYVWEVTPLLTSTPVLDGAIRVNYADGSSEVVSLHIDPLMVSDAEKYTPIAVEGLVMDPKTDFEALAAEDFITNTGDIPGASYAWEVTPLLTSTPVLNGVIRVTYADGTSEVVEVHIEPEVKSQAEMYKPEAGSQVVRQGDEAYADLSIANKFELPKGTKYAWKVAPDTKNLLGDVWATVIVTYPDGTSEEVPVIVSIRKDTDAIMYMPKAGEQIVKPGQPAYADLSISNKFELPKGTKYAWKVTPDTSKVGDIPATVIVTYPDGSSEEVDVIVYVRKAAAEKPGTPTKPATTVEKVVKKSGKELPETGESSNTVLFSAAAVSVLAGLGLVVGHKKQED